MIKLPFRPDRVENNRHFLIGNNISWTDVQRRKQHREALHTLHERLPEAEDYAEKQHIKEVIELIEDEVDQWTII